MPSGVRRSPEAAPTAPRRGADRLVGLGIAVAASLLLWALIAAAAAAVIAAVP